jgi:subtilisin family serine protease
MGVAPVLEASTTRRPQAADLLSAFGLAGLMRASDGSREVILGMVDGPVMASHPDLERSRLVALSSPSVMCQASDSLACQHGTFIAGILASRRASAAPGLCPGCTLVVRPIFCEAVAGRSCPEVTPGDLARAVIETVDAGARVINLSVGLAGSAREDEPALDQAFDHARRQGCLVVAAAGNHGWIGHLPLFRHPWVIPVAACDARGRPLAASNLGADVGRRGLLAPGVGVTSTAAAGGHARLTGTSVATPFVTGTAGLLWSLHPSAEAAQIRWALLRPGASRRSIVPPLLNAEASLGALRSAL